MFHRVIYQIKVARIFETRCSLLQWRHPGACLGEHDVTRCSVVWPQTLITVFGQSYRQTDRRANKVRYSDVQDNL